MKKYEIRLLTVLGILVLLAGCSEDDETQTNAEPFIYRIPVIVHVVHNGEEVGNGPNISQAQVQSQIEVLNEDFRRISGTNGFNSDGVDTEIEFYLATTDPNGNVLAEPGIDRYDGGRIIWPTGLSTSVDSQLKPATIWDPNRYFNIWTVNFGGFVGRNLLGYAQFPSNSGLMGLNEDEGSAQTDGIVVGYKYFGSGEKGNFPDLNETYNLGRTATHEVGHWIGLRHIWGDGDCTVDDFCDDTPISDEPNYSCETHVSCGTQDMIENYMDYTEDQCMSIFTQDQKDRMIQVLENSPRRNTLYN
ncbi:zinc metalloprotease [Croceitalea rosinachiae]|uniref:Zinc metalloprotease n=1 Tax=Croceitalea rosinachiae TaxID=3075596 RepID=A0ABU3A7P4_9FLAO|nr:zinc metalloprotease [Croceitalea sp. F388]MDT0605954.1 zinc metalloprotease [Croceitalea sp. F388]